MVGQIRIDNVQKKFINPDGSEVVALNDLSFTVKPGSFVSLIGPSGCGKTTLLRAIAGLNLPDRGGIYLDGEKITKAGADRGYAFQQANLFPWLNIRNNVAFGLKARGEYKEKKEDVDQFLELVGLKDLQIHITPALRRNVSESSTCQGTGRASQGASPGRTFGSS